MCEACPPKGIEASLGGVTGCRAVPGGASFRLQPEESGEVLWVSILRKPVDVRIVEIKRAGAHPSPIQRCVLQRG